MPDFLKQQVLESQASDPIKEETARILDEAKEIRARINNEEAQKEYDEVRLSTIWALKDLRAETHEDLETIRAELGTSHDPFNYAQGEINQTELGNIKREFEELKDLDLDNNRTNEVEWRFWNIMLGYIESTNEKILNGWEEELNNQLNWYLTAFGSDEWSWGFQANAAYLWASAVLSDETMQSSVEKIMSIKNSSESLETKLFALSKMLYEVWKEAGAPPGLESAHNQATRNIIKKVIENSEKTFAVWFTPETWYYVNEWELDKNNFMEVGTFLCSLNKGWTLTKDNLLQDKGPFSATELFDLIENYKQGDFGGPEVQWLFTGYLTDFEDNMRKVAEDYLANEQNWAHIIDFFNAQQKSWNQRKIYEEDDVSGLAKKTETMDLHSLKDNELQEKLFEKRKERAIQELLNELSKVYEGWPDMLDILISIIASSEQWVWDGEDFYFWWINEIISEFNQENWRDGKQYPLIVWDLQQSLKNILNWFNKTQLLSWNYSQQLESIKSIEEATWKMKGYIEYLQDKYKNIQDASQIIIPSDLSPWEKEEYQKAINLYFHSYTFDEIQENPKIRLSKITEKNVLLSFLIEYQDDEKLQKINFQHLPRNLRNDTEVALAFPWEIKENDFPFMHPSLLKDTDFIEYIINRDIERWNIDKEKAKIIWLLLQRFCASGWDKRAMVKILHEIFQNHPDFRNQVHEYIPLSIINSDNENILWVSENNSILSESWVIWMLTSLWDMEGPSDYENRFIPAFRNADIFLERHPGNEKVKLLLIEKGWLSHTQYLKGNLWLDRSSITWEAILEHDINSIRFLEEGTRKSPYFQEKFVQHIPENWLQSWSLDNWHLINYIPFDSPEEIHNFMKLLKNRFPKYLSWEWDQEFDNAVYTFIWSNEKFKNIITAYFEQIGDAASNETISFVRKCIFTSAWFSWKTAESVMRFQEKHRESTEIYSSAFKQTIYENFWDLNLNSIFRESNNNDDPTTKIEVVMDILKNSSVTDITDWDGMILAEIFGRKLPKFLDLCKIFEWEQIQKQIEEAQEIPIEESEYPVEFKDFLIENNNWDFTRNIEKISNIIWMKLLAEMRLNNITGDKKQEYCIKYLISEYKLSQEKAQEIFSQILDVYFRKEELETFVPETAAKAMTDGNYQEYIQELRKDLGNKAVLRIYPNAQIDENWEIHIPEAENNTTSPSAIETNLPQNNPGIMTRITQWESWEYFLNSEIGTIPLSNDIFKIIVHHPEAEKNLISTFTILKETWLEKFWTLGIIENIMQGISNMRGIAFQSDENFLNINEQKMLFDYILISIGETPLKASTTLWTQGIISELQQRNNTSIMWEEARNLSGDTRIEALFFKKFYPKGTLYFHQSAFETALSGPR